VTYSLHPGAEHDIAIALDFYAEQAGPAVAKRFLEEFEFVAKLLVEYPGLGTPTTRGRRSFPLKVFP
jgi:plasmid stabilization system protein ParE